MNRSGPLGPNDDSWLTLAHALSRFASVPEREMLLALPGVADAMAVSAVTAGLSAQSPVLRCARALRALDEPIVLPSGHAPIAELFFATQSVAEEQELSGAFGLAFVTLSGLLRAFGERAAPRAQGSVLAQTGRVVRQMGLTDLAQEYYEDAMTLGYECEALDVVARALLGTGVLALTRGNYPMAREQFERALVNAERATDPEMIRSSHHGLMNCSIASGDLDSALVHGWNVLRLCIAPESRAEALLNMAEICRLTGEHDAAIRVYAVAVEWTSQRGLRLNALSGALHCAVALRRVQDARRYVGDIDEMMPQVLDYYTLADVGVEIAESLYNLGEIDTARERLASAIALANTHTFHEVIDRAERVTARWDAAQRPNAGRDAETVRRSVRRSTGFRTVLRSLNGLAASSL
ncbi:MAG: hypothetical protein H7099_19865 [Gemmatimonadaceae bacterium]|nr:hypothetical protein [Gemmatimonadaceae bacterium]